MTEPRNEPELKRMVNLGIVGENIMDIADYAIEKYEFTNKVTLSEEDREKATEQIRDELWERVKRFRNQRKEWLRRLFLTADDAVRSSVEGS